MRKWIGGIVLGFVLGVLCTCVLIRRGYAKMYDNMILIHVHEAIMNAEQIRRGEGEKVLALIDAWLQGEQIDRSIDGFMISAGRKSEALQAINKYRSKYEPVESPNKPMNADQ